MAKSAPNRGAAGNFLFIAIDQNTIPNEKLTDITWLATFIASLDTEGMLVIKDRYGNIETGDYIDLATKIARLIGADLSDPERRGLVCTCPKECDCFDPDKGLKSMECPIHNETPQPSPNCPQHGYE